MRPAMTDTTPDYAGLSRSLGALAYHIHQTGTADGQDAQTCLEVAEAIRELLAENERLKKEMEYLTFKFETLKLAYDLERQRPIQILGSNTGGSNGE